jgi:homoserine kinase
VNQARRTPVLLEGLKRLSPELIKIGVEDDLHVASRLRLLTGAKSVLEFAEKSGALGATLSGAGSALLILTRTGSMQKLEAKLAQHVKRLWGKSGKILDARVRLQGPSFS